MPCRIHGRVAIHKADALEASVAQVCVVGDSRVEHRNRDAGVAGRRIPGRSQAVRRDCPLIDHFGVGGGSGDPTAAVRLDRRAGSWVSEQFGQFGEVGLDHFERRRGTLRDVFPNDHLDRERARIGGRRCSRHRSALDAGARHGGGEGNGCRGSHGPNNGACRPLLNAGETAESGAGDDGSRRPDIRHQGQVTAGRTP